MPSTSRAARDFFCFVCGVKIYSDSGLTICQHLLFAFSEVTDCFDFCRNDLDEKKILSISKLKNIDPVSVLREQISSDSIVIINIIAESNVSGPSAVSIGIDFVSLDKERSNYE